MDGLTEAVAPTVSVAVMTGPQVPAVGLFQVMVFAEIVMPEGRFKAE
jgi:hypothetical protein